jgi:hypothetical protein
MKLSENALLTGSGQCGPAWFRQHRRDLSTVDRATGRSMCAWPARSRSGKPVRRQLAKFIVGREILRNPAVLWSASNLGRRAGAAAVIRRPCSIAAGGAPL